MITDLLIDTSNLVGIIALIEFIRVYSEDILNLLKW